MTPALLLKKLDALIGTSAAHVWQNARWANGPLSGVMVPPEGDWKALAIALCNRGPANWVGKHFTSTWMNDEGSLGDGAGELMCCVLNAAGAINVDVTTNGPSIVATFREFLRVLEWKMATTGDLPPLCWLSASKVNIGAVGQAVYEQKSTLDDGSALKLAGALALGVVVFDGTAYTDIVSKCRLLLDRIAARVARIVKRHGGCCGFHDPVTDDMSSARSFEPAALNTAATADAMLILEIAETILLGSWYGGLAITLRDRLRRWEYTYPGLATRNMTWDLWVRPVVPSDPDRSLGVGCDAEGRLVGAAYAVWPSQTPGAAPAIGIPRADYPRRQLERFEYARSLAA